MSDLVGVPEDRFSHDEAHIYNWVCEAGLSGATTRTFRFRCELLHRGTPVGASPSCHSETLETIQGFPEWLEWTAARLHANAMFLLLRP